MNLEKLLETIDSLFKIAENIPAVGNVANISDSLLSIAIAAVKKHQEIVGTPLDLSKLHDIQPL